jgi:hypothetical protein
MTGTLPVGAIRIRDGVVRLRSLDIDRGRFSLPTRGAYLSLLSFSALRGDAWLGFFFLLTRDAWLVARALKA